jgi:hypothetical protein
LPREEETAKSASDPVMMHPASCDDRRCLSKRRPRPMDGHARRLIPMHVDRWGLTAVASGSSCHRRRKKMPLGDHSFL